MTFFMVSYECGLNSTYPLLQPCNISNKKKIMSYLKKVNDYLNLCERDCR